MQGLPCYDAKRGCGIGVVDPGAVPGGSTKFPLFKQGGNLWGRNRIDTRNKGDLRRSVFSAVIGKF